MGQPGEAQDQLGCEHVQMERKNGYARVSTLCSIGILAPWNCTQRMRNNCGSVLHSDSV